MTDFTTVSAVAIVKARDGSSIEDWEEDSGVSADHYLADPDRIRAAIRALEEGGLTVKAIGDVTITFSGSAALMSAAFGETINTDDLEHPSWTSTGGPVLALPAGHQLSTQLSSVRLDSAPTPEQRNIGPFEAKGSQIKPLDLLVGEVGQTLGSSDQRPERLKGPTPKLPITEIDIRTKESVKSWQKILGKSLATLEANLPSDRRKTWIHIHEFYAGTSALTMLDRYGLLEDPPMYVRSSVNDPLDIYRMDGLWDNFHGRMAEAVLERLLPALGRAQKASKEMHVEYKKLKLPLIEKKEARLRVAISAMAAASSDVARCLGYLKKKEFVFRKDLRAPLRKSVKDDEVDLIKTLKRIDAEDMKDQADELTDIAVAKPLDSNRANRAEILFKGLGQICVEMAKALIGLNGRMSEERISAVTSAYRHALMVAFATNGVTTGLVRTSLRGEFCDGTGEQVGHTSSYLWSPEIGSEKLMPNIWQNHVISASWGTTVSKSSDWPEQRKRLRQELAFALSNPRVLRVISAGNQSSKGSQVSAFLSGADNVILVGGCEPFIRDDQLLWKANETTHGYGYRIKSEEFYVPDICATTMGNGGGSMIFPFPRYDRNENSMKHLATQRVSLEQEPIWYTGSGSSLSCPIVAAAASLVWFCFSEISSSQLKELLLASAELLDGGNFCVFPSALTDKQTKNVVFESVLPENKGQGMEVLAVKQGRQRVHLWNALAAAEKLVKDKIASDSHPLLASPAKRGR